jgi:hypothetical protein
LRSFKGFFCVFAIFKSWDFGDEANPKSMIKVYRYSEFAVLGLCGPNTKGRKVAPKKHAEAPLQRTKRQKGDKQAPGCGGARELHLLFLFFLFE